MRRTDRFVIALMMIIFLVICAPRCFGFESKGVNMIKESSVLLDMKKAFGSDYEVQDIRISPDGAYIAVALRRDIYLLDTRNGGLKKIFSNSHKDAIVYSCKFSNTGKYLGICGGPEFGCYDLVSNKYHSYSMILFNWNSPESIFFSEKDWAFVMTGRIYYIDEVLVIADIETGVFSFFNLMGGSEEANRGALLRYSDIRLFDADRFQFGYSRPRRGIKKLKGFCNLFLAETGDGKGPAKKVVSDKVQELINALHSKEESSPSPNCFFLDNSNYFVCITRKAFLKISLDNEDDFKYIRFPEESKVISWRPKKSKNNIFLLSGWSEVKDKSMRTLYLIDAESLKMLEEPINVRAKDGRGFDISPSGEFIVYMDDNKLCKKSIAKPKQETLDKKNPGVKE